MTKPFSIRIISWILFTAILLSAECVLWIAWVLSFFPIKPSPLLVTLFARHQPLVASEHDMGLYRLFILLVIIFTVVGLMIAQRKMQEEKTQLIFKSFVVVQAILLIMIGWAYFKWLLYGVQHWPNVVLGFVLFLSILSKVFFPELLSCVGYVRRGVVLLAQHQFKTVIANVAMGILLFSLIAVRDVHAVLAKMFLTDHFHHLDTMITSPAWAFMKGLVLDIDTFTHYAVGLPIVTALGMKLLGGFTYEHLLIWMLLITMIYYFIFFQFVRRWLGSFWLAGAASVLLIKWNMFHPGVTPLIFNYPSASVLRYPLDVVFIWMMYRQLMNPRWLNLALGSLMCGFSLFYMIDSGLYMIFTWFIFLAYTIWESKRAGTLGIVSIGQAIASIGLTVGSWFTLLCLTQGGWLFTSLFWKNLGERTALFLMGHGNILMTQSMVQGKCVEGLIGFIIPIIYVVALGLSAALVHFKQISRQWILVSFIAVYGLASYHYYVCRSADTSYDVVCMPLVLILALAVKLVMNQWSSHARAIAGGFFIFTFVCLLTTHQFLNYPNWWHLSANPIVRPQVPLLLEGKISFMNHHQVMWDPSIKLSTNSLKETDEGIKTEKDFANDRELKEYFAQEFDFSDDAQLIMQATGVDDRVALISSFETKILMQANRKPFFYYFPLVDSRPMRMRMFDMTALWTVDRLNKTLKQLMDQKPQYVFMEKILLAKSVPQAYQYLYPDLLVILNYLGEQYQPVAEGKYLVALKRK